MKIIKTLLAVSVIAATGATHAVTVATYNADVAITLSGIYAGGGSATGLATLDDSGSLTVTAQGDTTIPSSGTTTLGTTTIFSGTYLGGIFTPSSGTLSTTFCSPASSIGCTTLGSLPTIAVDVGAVSGSITSTAGGKISTSQPIFGGQETVASVFTFTPSTPSPVPVPAAAWLFGSGLMGLIGAARNRRWNNS